METQPTPPEYTLRPAVAADAGTIRHIISVAQINPTALSWRRFVLAVNQDEAIIGCGQVKPHSDGSLELASIAVLPEWRGMGIARAIIEHLLEQNPGRLYLTCRAQLEPLYEKFGFHKLASPEMPPYFQRLSRLVAGLNKLLRLPGAMLVMRRN